jgi:hypothetical protein
LIDLTRRLILLQRKAEWFNRAITLNKEINILIEKRSHIYSAAMKTTPTYSDMPKAPNTSSSLQNAIDKICEIDDAINEMIDLMYLARCEITDAIGSIECNTDRICMKLRFVDLKSWGEIESITGIKRNSIPYHVARGINSTKYCISA